jgi:hypothetical protein
MFEPSGYGKRSNWWVEIYLPENSFESHRVIVSRPSLREGSVHQQAFAEQKASHAITKKASTK